MTEKDRLLRRALRRIQEHGYYHRMDIALITWFTSDASVKEICARYDVSPAAIYKQKSRLLQESRETS
jgi:hypothetical protein